VEKGDRRKKVDKEGSGKRTNPRENL